MRQVIRALALTTLAAPVLAAQQTSPPQQTSTAAAALSQQVRERYVSVSEPVVALTNVTVIDGTGSAPKADQTVVIRNGLIAEVGPAARVTVPSDARRL